METEILIRLKCALQCAYCMVYYYFFESKDGYCEEQQTRYYSAKADVYFPRGMDDSITKQIKEVAKDNFRELQSCIKINISISVDRFLSVCELPEDCDLFPNPQDFYVVEGSDLRPQIVSEKKGVISRGLSDIPCFLLKRDVEDVSDLNEKEQAKYINKIKKLPPKYVRGTYTSTYGGFSETMWFDPWVVKHHFVNDEPDAPRLFYHQKDHQMRKEHEAYLKKNK